VGKVTPLGQDPATQKQHALVSAITATEQFGTPVQQEGSNGQEFLFHCPLCISDDNKGTGHRPHLRVSKATNPGRVEPFLGCRVHDTKADFSRIKKALVAAGVKSDLLGVLEDSSQDRRVPGNSPADVDKAIYAEFKSRPEGLGETHPIPEGRVQRWAAALWEKDSAALEYLANKRGLTKQTIKAAEFGLSGNRIILPIRGADGSVVSARYRVLQKDGNVSPWKPFPHPRLKKEDGKTPLTYGAPTRLYGVRELAIDTPGGIGDLIPVWVCAGEFDRLTLLQCGALSVCSTNGEGSLPRLEDAEYLTGRDVYVVYDCDKAGRKGARKFAAAACKVGARNVYVLDLDPDRNDGYDISQFFLDNDTPDYDAFQGLADRISVLDPYELPENSTLDLSELSDRRMAEIVAERYCNELKFVVPSQTWISWNGQRWDNFAFRDNSAATNAIVKVARDIKDAAKTFDDPEWIDKVRGWSQQYVNRTHASAREHLTTIDKMRVQLDRLDRLPVLNTPNGILDLTTGTVRPHDPEAYLRWITNGSYFDKTARQNLDPERKAMFTAWSRFVRRAIPSQELRRYVQKLLGYSLLDGNPQRLLIFVKGGTSTGKSVFAETIMEALGSYAGPFNMSLLRDNQDEKPRADIVESLTQRIVFAAETSTAWHLHSDAIKRMTGGDKIKARLPHRGEYFVRTPAFTPWVMTNEVPNITAADLALDRRLVVIPFEEVIKPGEEDHEGMLAMRRNGGDAVITWAVEGLLRWLSAPSSEQLGFAVPAASIEAKFEFSSQLSPMHLFLEEVCERGTPGDPDYEVAVSELYSQYEMWCSVNGIREVTNKIEFGKRLSGIGIAVRIQEGVRYRTGIRLKQAAVR
jgi:P4 family phage/plasmid primase-like protien